MIVFFFFRKAIRDIRQNVFLNLASIATIALTVMIVGGMLFFYINAGAILSSWVRGIRIMAYLHPGLDENAVKTLSKTLSRFSGVGEVRFISRDEALGMMKKMMENQASIFEDLSENPLPDAFEIQMQQDEKGLTGDLNHYREIAKKIAELPEIKEVEYAGAWLRRFASVVELFRLAGYFLAGMVIVAGIFFVGNTIRLILYNRREEVEIMRFVGASDAFIHTPFFIQGMVQGLMGSLAGIFFLFVLYRYISLHGLSMLGAEDAMGGLSFLEGTTLNLVFLPPAYIFTIICISMVVGWLGSFLSLQRLFRFSA